MALSLSLATRLSLRLTTVRVTRTQWPLERVERYVFKDWHSLNGMHRCDGTIWTARTRITFGLSCERGNPSSKVLSREITLLDCSISLIVPWSNSTYFGSPNIPVFRRAFLQHVAQQRSLSRYAKAVRRWNRRSLAHTRISWNRTWTSGTIVVFVASTSYSAYISLSWYPHASLFFAAQRATRTTSYVQRAEQVRSLFQSCILGLVRRLQIFLAERVRIG